MHEGFMGDVEREVLTGHTLSNKLQNLIRQTVLERFFEPGMKNEFGEEITIDGE